MGIVGCKCCSANKDESKSEMIYTEIIQENMENSSEEKGEGKKKIFYAHRRNLSDFGKNKIIFENELKEQGEFIFNKDIEDIINEINPAANEIEIPDDITNAFCEDGFEAPPIKFKNGEIYKGWWNRENQRDGYGINIKPDGTIYKGLWENNQMGKKGLYIEKNGDYYLGELVDGKYEGKGKMLMNGKFFYDGNLTNEIPDGEGKLINYTNDTVYEGSFKMGLKDGKGKLTYKDGTIYEGEFKNDKFDGFGKFTYSNGCEFEGQFQDNKIKGKGKYKWADGSVYEGEYDDFVKQGKGKYYWDDNKYYIGEWLNGKQHGKGQSYYNGRKVKGIFRFGTVIMEDESQSSIYVEEINTNVNGNNIASGNYVDGYDENNINTNSPGKVDDI